MTDRGKTDCLDADLAAYFKTLSPFEAMAWRQEDDLLFG